MVILVVKSEYYLNHKEDRYKHILMEKTQNVIFVSITKVNVNV